MIMIIKAIGVLFLDIAIYYVIGTAITERFKNRIKRNVAFHIIIGFIVYQIIFQVCAIPFIWLKRSLDRINICMDCVDNSHRNCGGGESKETDSRRFLFCEKKILKEHRLLMGITIIAVLIVCWYTTLNGELNDDSIYYIGVVNTTVTTDTMFQYNAYTGVAMPISLFQACTGNI